MYPDSYYKTRENIPILMQNFVKSIKLPSDNACSNIFLGCFNSHIKRKGFPPLGECIANLQLDCNLMNEIYQNILKAKRNIRASSVRVFENKLVTSEVQVQLLILDYNPLNTGTNSEREFIDQ